MTTKQTQPRFTQTTTSVDQFISTSAPDLNDYISEVLGTRNWEVCSNTKNNRAKYGVCLSHPKYHAFAHQYLEDGGDPDEIVPWIAGECGWVLRWVRSDTVPETGEQAA